MSARTTFKNILTAGWDGVLAWNEGKQEETLFLEFKGQRGTAHGIFSEEDRSRLAQAISGFANSEGGVLVFGIETSDRGKNYPDQVQRITPIPDVLKFKGAIQRAVHEVTDPPVQGVQVEHIEDLSQPGKGVVTVYIPQSYGGPHRVVRGRAEVQDRYYMRTAVQTVNMHHALLATMFGRTSPPRLQLKLALQFSPLNPGWNLVIRMRLTNLGRGVAVKPAIRLYDFPKASIANFWRLALNPAQGAFRKLIWDYEPMQDFDGQMPFVTVRPHAELVIYPGDEIIIAQGPVIHQHGSLSAPFDLPLKGIIFAVDSQPILFDTVLKIRMEGESANAVVPSAEELMGETDHNSPPNAG